MQNEVDREVQQTIAGAPELEYKENFKEVIARSLALIHGKQGVLLCAEYERPDIPERKLTPLEEIDFDKDPFCRIREMCRYHERFFPIFKDLPDDHLPVAGLDFGTGFWAGLCNGQMRFGNDTSWVEPWAETLDGLLEIEYKGRTRWFDLFVEAQNMLNRHAQGKYMAVPAGSEHTALEFLSMIRGAPLFTDMYDEPEKLIRVLIKYQEMLIDLYRRFRLCLENQSYGYSAWGSLWLPKGIVLSDDAAGMLSPELYRKFGAWGTQDMCRAFGMGVLHFHALGYHQRDALCEMPDLVMHNWRDDPNVPGPMEKFDYILEGARRKIVMMSATPQQIRENISRFNQGRFVLHTWCKTRQEAIALIDFVKAVAAPG